MFINRDENIPEPDDVRYCEPNGIDAKGKSFCLKHDTCRADIERLFGVASGEDVDDHEVVLTYQVNKLEMYFEIDLQSDRLKRWNLYLA